MWFVKPTVCHNRRKYYVHDVCIFVVSRVAIQPTVMTTTTMSRESACLTCLVLSVVNDDDTVLAGQ